MIDILSDVSKDPLDDGSSFTTFCSFKWAVEMAVF